MRILIVAATRLEITPFLSQWDDSNPDRNGISVLITGVGSVATTYHLTRALQQSAPDLTIQAGIAGAFSENAIGHTYTVQDDCFADLGVWEQGGFADIFQLGLQSQDEAPFSGGRLVNPWTSLLALSAAPGIRAITVNEITTDGRHIHWYQQYHQSLLESMEGAAFHYVCLQQGIPFIQLRSVSNLIGIRDKSKWCMKPAIENLNQHLINLVNNLANYDETYFRI